MVRQPLAVAAVSLDCADHDELAEFYVRLLDAAVLWRTDTSAGVRAGPYTLVMQRVERHRTPPWPGNSIVHLDLAAEVSELERQRDFAVACGATIAPTEPDPRWIVLLDPAGHPFCLTPITPPS